MRRRGDEAFGLAVRKEREDRGLSQERLGEISELHRNYIGGVERGELNPTLRTFRRIAAGLGISASALVARAELIVAEASGGNNRRRRSR